MAERQYSLAVCRFPGNSAEHPASSGWVLAHVTKWADDPRISRVIPLRRSDTPITMVRNLLVKSALEYGADYILMIDSDMQPDVEPDGKPFWDTAWDFLMERRAREEAHGSALAGYETATRLDQYTCKIVISEVPVEEELFRLYPPATIGAPYCGPPPFENVYVMKWAGHETNTPDHPRPYALTAFDRDHAAGFAGIGQVVALPTGLILYDARVFRRLPPPWFEYEWTDVYHTEKASTEDIFQTRNAHLADMPQFCAWDCWAGHIKNKVVRKPRPLGIEAVPNALADAIRKSTRGDHKVVILQSPEDCPARPVRANTDSLFRATTDGQKHTEASS